MKGLKVSILILVALVLLFLVSSFNNEPDIDSPDKVIFYNKGKAIELERNDDVRQQAIGQTLNRFQDRLDTLKLALEENGASKMKNNELVLEFIYLSQQETTFKLSGFQTRKIQYTRLLFPLTGNYKELIFFGDNSTYLPGPLGDLSGSEDLIKLLSRQDISYN